MPFLGSGLAPATEGWFVVNVRDVEWWFADSRGARCSFESEYGEPAVEFRQLGINLTILEPGQTTLYHAESSQEAFLVLSGECRLLVEGEERVLRPWDFFHSPSWTEHAFVGAGDGPCVILMAGARGVATQAEEGQVRYPASELAARFGASVERRRPPIRRGPTRRPSGSAESAPRTGIACPGPRSRCGIDGLSPPSVAHRERKDSR
jgi:uncharacterized cupin superfamily protein